MDIIYRYDPHAPLVPTQHPNSRVALQALARGNQRYHDFVEKIQQATFGEAPSEQIVVPVNPLSLGVPLWKGHLPPQTPFALVVGCADARAPVEHIFDCASNDVFVVRVAGNVLGLECLGSVDYAVTHLRDTLRTVVVLGHTNCGAVAATVDIYLAPNEFATIAHSHAVRSLVDRLMITVRGAARALERVGGAGIVKAPNYRSLLLAASVHLNAAMTAFDLRREVSAMGQADLDVAFTVYDLGRSRVSALPLSGDADTGVPFEQSPASPEDLITLSTQIVERLVADMDPPPAANKKPVKKSVQKPTNGASAARAATRSAAAAASDGRSPRKGSGLRKGRRRPRA